MEEQPVRAGRQRQGRLFKLDLPPDSPLGRLTSRMSPALERLFALDALNAIYDRVSDARDPDPGRFLDRVLDDLGVSYRVRPEDLARVPAKGALVVVANHPFGAIEGIVLAHMLRTVRPDVRVMANFLLGRIPELRDLFVCVDPFGNEASAHYNLKPMRESLGWLRKGGALAVFPAGEVASLDLRLGGVAEKPWSPTIARLARRAGAAVLPVHFEGHNGPLFQLLGLVHPRVRTAMLPRELLKHEGGTLSLRIGSPVSPRRLAATVSDEAATDYLRQRMLLLKHRPASSAGASAGATPSEGEAIGPEVAPELLEAEIDALPESQRLVEAGEHRVYIARARQLPSMIREIGRVREITYRAVGEGTGKPYDLDEFDRWYRHLILWDAGAKKLVAAYRLGPTDRILRRRGLAGLYTSTLFQYEPGLLERLSPALELGRAFVRPEYQRSYAPLMLLWKGIARFVVLHPQYRMLFGPVSISNDYGNVSRELMVRFLQSNHTAPELIPLTRPRNPFPLRRGRAGVNVDLARLLATGDGDIDDLVSDLEPDGKGIPVLLRQYLKLGARFFAFNVDPAFGDSIDALMFVDLTQTDPRILERYMGKEDYRAFMSHHSPVASSACGGN